MKTLTYTYEKINPLDSLLLLCEKDDIVFFDIETTGLSKFKNHIYLIGCGYYSSNALNIIQWFAESEAEESLILENFINFSSSFSTLVNYNGKRFDIPFTTERLKKYCLCMPDFISIDLYTYVKPLKNFLSLNDTTQKSVEEFLQIKREDKYNGGELIPVYKRYISSKNQDNLDLLLLHNKEDVLNMHYLSKITEYSNLLNCNYKYEKAELREYSDYNGISKQELLIYGSADIQHNINNFNSFYSDAFGSFIMNFKCNGKVNIRIPVLNGVLKCFIANYKDYYYLPYEDICVYKGIASAVAKENKVNATKENCFIKYEGQFIPLKESTLFDNSIHMFKENYKSKQTYVRLLDIETIDDAIKNIYLKSLVHSFK